MSLSKALVVTRNLPPMVGGMERLIFHMVDELRAAFRVHVIGPMGCRAELPEDVTCSEIPISPLPWFLSAATASAAAHARRHRPSLVLAGSGLVAPPAYFAARIASAKSAVYLHGLDVEVDSRTYRRLWWPIFRRFDRALANSRFTASLLTDAGVHQRRIRVVPPGVELPAGPCEVTFRESYGLEDYPVMLYTGRITRRKGLGVFCENIFPKIARAIPDAHLVVIGDDPAGGLLKETSERARAEQALSAAGLSAHTRFLGTRAADDPELSAAYKAADVLVFPVQQRPHDNEGFGMVAIEAAAHGLPTVAFAAGGVPDAVADGISGRLIAPGDADQFAEATCELLRGRANQGTNEILRFAQRFQWPEFGRRLLDALRK